MRLSVVAPMRCIWVAGQLKTKALC